MYIPFPNRRSSAKANLSKRRLKTKRQSFKANLKITAYFLYKK